MFRYSKAEKRIIEAYRNHRMVHGVRVSIRMAAEELNEDRARVCEVLGFDPIKFLTED